MRKWFLPVIAAAFLLCVLEIPKLDRLLIYKDEPEKVDLIVVLGGGWGSRVEKGVELYRQGYAPTILLTGFNITNPEFRQLYVDLYRGYLLNKGVPKDRVYLDYRSKDTFEEAVNTCALIERRGSKSAIIVSDFYHMRRVKYSFDRVSKGKGIKLLYIPPNFEWVQGAWWKNEDDLLVVTNEIIKWVYYLWNY